MLKIKILLILTLSCIFSQSVLAQQPGQIPGIAYDTQNQRYLMIWEEVTGETSSVKGKFLNREGGDLDGQIHVLTPNRPRQGCFFENFSQDNQGVTEPTNCPRNSNPAVAYNNGTFLLVWDVSGQADFPSEAPNQENRFSGIFARLLDANNLQAVGNLDAEGILISKVQIAANHATGCGDGRYVCNDNDIQAWGYASKPQVAPNLSSDGFVVTWETNKDFIGCANPGRRGARSVYGRYIDAAFSSTGNNNPQPFAIYTDDSTLEESCAPLENINTAANPKVAFNATSNDFVVVYEHGRANDGRTSIGAKRVTVSGREAQVVGGAMMPGILASLEDANLRNPEIISFQSQYALFVEAADGIRGKFFQGSEIQNSTPAELNLNANNPKQPQAATNLGIGGQSPTLEEAPPRISLTYQQGENLFSVVLDESLNSVQDPSSFSQGISGNAKNASVASDASNFVVSWQGESNGDKVFANFIAATGEIPPVGEPPTQPQAETPSDGLTLPPTRAYLSWSQATDPEGGSVSYNLYIGEDEIPADPQASNLTETHFIIGPETEAETGLTLRPDTTYQWQVEAIDEAGLSTLSVSQTFSTDNSVVAWWRFDSDPNGAVCPGGSGGETVCDYSGNNHHGVPMGNPNWIAPGMPDILGGALQFDGVDDYVSVTSDPSLNIITQLTIEAALQAQGADSENVTIVARDQMNNQSAGNYYLLHNALSGLIRFDFYNGIGLNRAYEVPSTSLVAETRGLVSLRHSFGSGSSTEVRVNNVIQLGAWISGTGDEMPIIVDIPLGIGAGALDLGGMRFFTGFIEELIIYEKYLSVEELENSYFTKEIN